MIAIVGALDEELQAFLGHAQGLQTFSEGPFVFHQGTLAGHRVLLAKCGIGKVLSAMTTQKIITSFNPSHILFTGIAGALNPSLNVGDLVIGKDYVQHDFDAMHLGFKRGEIPYCGIHVLPADAGLLELARDFQPSAGKALVGRVLSGDQFITQSGTQSHSYLTAELQGDAIEMEGASVAVVCSLNKVPFLVLRTISDRADHAAAVDFQSFLPLASQQSLQVVQHVLGRLPRSL
ncbi:MAG: 5'-methylthioadenosine/adenosylhomocysteine nucleosidase [Deltaproteobacteria bacterium]|nr:5'-methylthioadenosine/adenosylhomocysteine nucleosidase [Deltaproteobacteria bacterium]